MLFDITPLKGLKITPNDENIKRGKQEKEEETKRLTFLLVFRASTLEIWRGIDCFPQSRLSVYLLNFCPCRFLYALVIYFIHNNFYIAAEKPQWGSFNKRMYVNLLYNMVIILSLNSRKWLLLGVEDAGHLKIEHHLTNLLSFDCFPLSFVPLFSFRLCHLCLLHQVRAW